MEEDRTGSKPVDSEGVSRRLVRIKLGSDYLGCGFLATLDYTSQKLEPAKSRVAVITAGHLLEGVEDKWTTQCLSIEFECEGFTPVDGDLAYYAWDLPVLRDIAVILLPDGVVCPEPFQVEMNHYIFDRLDSGGPMYMAGFPDLENGSASVAGVSMGQVHRQFKAGPESSYFTVSSTSNQSFAGFSGGPIVCSNSGKAVAVVSCELNGSNPSNDLKVFPICRLLEPSRTFGIGNFRIAGDEVMSYVVLENSLRSISSMLKTESRSFPTDGNLQTSKSGQVVEKLNNQLKLLAERLGCSTTDKLIQHLLNQTTSKDFEHSKLKRPIGKLCRLHQAALDFTQSIDDDNEYDLEQLAEKVAKLNNAVEKFLGTEAAIRIGCDETAARAAKVLQASTSGQIASTHLI